jgi:hypothetical protein
MASYTDTRPPSFTPYIAQQDVDTMSKVGMAKQAQYQQGYEKIQQAVDKVAGLDIYRDVDKNYLQTKLNELQTDLTSVAAGDFSNFQLTNSVAGMASKISNDENIINAVSSTKLLKKELAYMESERKAGKSSIENMYDLNKYVQAYTASNKIGESFNAKYTPYIDLSKKWQEVYKALHPNATEQDFAYGPNGQPTETMKRKMYEGVSQEQIENAIRSSFTPADLNQLRISANYQFKDMGPNDLAAYADRTYADQELKIDKKIKELSELASLSSGDPTLKNKYLSSIKFLEEKKASLPDKLAETKAAYEANPEAAFASIYKEEAVSQFSNSHAWETKKINELTNPALQEVHWRNEQALREATYRLAVAKETFDQKMAIKDDARKDTELSLKIKEAALKEQAAVISANGLLGGATVYGGENTDYKDPVIAVNEDIVAGKKQYNDVVLKIAKERGLQPGQVNYRMNKYKEGNLTAIPDEYKAEVDNAFKAKNKADLLDNALTQTRQDVLNTPLYKQKLAAVNQALSSVGSITIQAPNGTKVTYSPQELLNFRKNNKLNAYMQPNAEGMKSQTASAYSRGPLAGGAYMGIQEPQISAKEKILRDYLIGNKLGSKEIGKTLLKLDPIARENAKVLQELDADVKKALLPKISNYIPVTYDINFPDKASSNARNKMEGIAMDATLVYSPVLGGIEGGAETFTPDDRTTLQSWLAPDSKVRGGLQYKKFVKGGKANLMVVNGTESIVVPLPASLEAALPMNRNAPSIREQEVRQIQQLNGGIRTNPTKDISKSLYQPEDFRKLNNISITGNLNAASDNGSKQFLELTIQLPSGPYTAQSPLPLTIEAADEMVNNKMNINWVKQFFNTNPNVSPEIKKEISKLK